MSRYIAIEGCKKCPHRHYYSVGLYECLKYGTVLPASHILDIPEWCPLPKLPTPASAPETVAAPEASIVKAFERSPRRVDETSPVQAVCDRAEHLADVPAPFTAGAPVPPETLWYCICGQSNFVTVFRCEKCDRRRRPNLNRGVNDAHR